MKPTDVLLAALDVVDDWRGPRDVAKAAGVDPKLAVSVLRGLARRGMADVRYVRKQYTNANGRTLWQQQAEYRPLPGRGFDHLPLASVPWTGVRTCTTRWVPTGRVHTMGSWE
jgi:hypothetical protein